jgi:hypothetical protein
MQLENLLFLGKTMFSAGSYPKDQPINDPKSGFVQKNSYYETYESTVTGQVNNGSILSNILSNTTLDNTDANPEGFNLNTDIITNYGTTEAPSQVQMGEFGGAPTSYQQVYSPTNTYLDNVQSLIDTVNNPQVTTLDKTALDNTNNNAAPTALVNTPTIPDTITDYPAENVTSIIGGAPQPFDQLWGESKPYYDYMKTNFEAQ